MELKIERIVLHNFKGLKHENLLFNNNNVTVSGANGTGKSSVMAAWFWMMADVSETLVSNPPVFPLDSEECTPSVEVICNLDGKQITLERQIKRTVKKSKTEGMNDSVSFSSTYFVNGCEFGLRDFHKKLEEYGITDKFLTLSHPDVFLLGKKDEMRRTLFGMAKAKSDYEVAYMTEGAEDVAKLLKDYKFEEVEGMQKSTLRKIREIYGASGELINSRIEGLESAKVDVDFAEIELQRNLVKEKLKQNQAEQETCEQIERDLNELRGKDLTLQMELSGIVQKQKAEKKALEEKIYSERRALQEQLSQLDRDISRWENEVETNGTTITRLKTQIKQGQDAVSKIEAEVLDEDSLYCPTCGQLYKFEKREEVRRDFEAHKLKRIADLHTEITNFMSMTESLRTTKAELAKKIQKVKNDKADIETALNKPLNAFDGTMEEPHTYQADKDRLESEIAANNALMESKKAGLKNMTLLKAEELNLHDELRNCEIQLSKADTNNEIDEKIEALREQQTKYEQNKADAERILYLLSLVQKRKNELLTEEINAHFKLVRFSFFEYQKNGEYKECCKAFVGDKELGSALNNATQIKAKVDICNGLQNFYNEHYPIWLDNSEALDTENQAQLEADTQLILLRVTDGKSLFVKED